MPDFIAVYDDALDAELCHEIAQKFASAEGDKYVGRIGAGVDKSMKDSIDVNVTRSPDWKPLHDRIMLATRQHLARYVREYPYLLVGAVASGFDNPETGQREVLRPEHIDENIAAQLLMHLYRPGDIYAQFYAQGSGGYHHWHSEVYPRDATCETLHRVLLFMYYVNTIEEGGETEFFYQEKKIAPQAGRMVIAPAGFTHTHKGHVARSDDKLILTSWVMFNRAEKLYPQG